MIYWYTGQPGHGKTLHAIDHALKFRDEGRLVFVGNVRGFKHDTARCLPITPEQFRDWMNFLPDGAVCFIDEAYESEMLPKRPPGSKVPDHVRELAKHRHRGLDFIFVSQSPAKQVDEFVHDLIERHIHVRRRFGLPFAHLRIFDRFERNPEKASPLILKRVKLPKRPMGLYESTVMDTVEKKIPWYYIALAIGLPATAYGAWHQFGAVEDSLAGKSSHAAMVATKDGAANGASATVAATDIPPPAAPSRESDYVAWLTPRIPGQPWTAPAYDKLNVPMQAPRVFCMASGHDGHDGCTCLSEQGTRHVIEQNRCRMIALDGQYEPFLDEVQGDRRRLDEATQRRQLMQQEISRGGVGGTPPTDNALPGATLSAPQVSGYGDIEAVRVESAPR
ncbi:zonular occludens toxin domain-containing protein [Lysobacter soli]|uniref:zonular occludens toxin domain-containing protein n=1 Tax=Lysobacter soli TaxID=453783 RepID=UPI002410854B|nr:zonular occludens toxin domain-containing protein [Lysobacter soli]MDG2518404.1 zonular occludens toxin domain-containing protein [Lysobacter soli]